VRAVVRLQHSLEQWNASHGSRPCALMAGARTGHRSARGQTRRGHTHHAGRDFSGEAFRPNSEGFATVVAKLWYPVPGGRRFGRIRWDLRPWSQSYGTRYRGEAFRPNSEGFATVVAKLWYPVPGGGVSAEFGGICDCAAGATPLDGALTMHPAETAVDESAGTRRNRFPGFPLWWALSPLLNFFSPPHRFREKIFLRGPRGPTKVENLESGNRRSRLPESRLCPNPPLECGTRADARAPRPCMLYNVSDPDRT